MSNLEPDQFKRFYSKTVEYLIALPEEKRHKLVYDALLSEQDEEVVPKITILIRDLHLLNLSFVKEHLQSDNFELRKRALKPLTSNKAFYNKEDIQILKEILTLISNVFPERGQRSFKKQMLSSKEKEVWICECNKQNDIEEHCSNCKRDIYGFKSSEVDAKYATKVVLERIELIEACLS